MVFVDCDLCLFLLASMVIRRPASVEEGFRIEMPLVFHYGYKTPGENIGLYNEIVSSMAMYVNIRSENVEKCENLYFLFQMGKVDMYLLGLFYGIGRYAEEVMNFLH